MELKAFNIPSLISSKVRSDPPGGGMVYRLGVAFEIIMSLTILGTVALNTNCSNLGEGQSTNGPNLSVVQAQPTLPRVSNDEDGAIVVDSKFHKTASGAMRVEKIRQQSFDKATSFFLLDERNWWVGAKNGVYWTKDAGKTWEAKRLFFEGDLIVRFIQFRNMNQGWLVTEPIQKDENIDADRHFAVFTTSDGGRSWAIQLQKPSASVTDFQVMQHSAWLTGINYFEMSSPKHIGNVLFLFQDDKNDWTDASDLIDAETNDYPEGVMALTSTSDEDAYLVTSNGRVFNTIDGGDKWKQVCSFEPHNNAIKEIGTYEGNGIWVIDASSGREGIGSRLMFFPRNSTVPSQTRNLPGSFIQFARYMGNGEYLAAGNMILEKDSVEKTDRVILYSRDYGDSWETIFHISSRSSFQGLGVTGQNQVVAMLDDGRFIFLKRDLSQ